VVGRHLCMHPYFFFNLLFVLAWLLCEFHTEQWEEHCSVPVGCLPHTFLQSIVCRSAVNSLKSWRAVLLLQGRWWEGAFTFPYFLLRLLSLLWRIIFLCWWVQYRCSVLKVCSSEYSQTHTLRRLNTFGQHRTW
jgi:hypothetical protein